MKNIKNMINQKYKFKDQANDSNRALTIYTRVSKHKNTSESDPIKIKRGRILPIVNGMKKIKRISG